jgi:hypothetical protein
MSSVNSYIHLKIFSNSYVIISYVIAADLPRQTLESLIDIFPFFIGK